MVYLIGTIGMLLLAGGIFFFFIAYQKKLLQKQLELNRMVQNQQEEIIKNTIEAQENERKRIARDLHDEVGAMLSVVKLTVGRIEKKIESGKTKELASETKTYLDDVILQVRRISRSLLPPSLEKLGLYFALEELADWVNKSDQLAIDCWKSGEQFRFDSKQELAVFRIVQELVNNAIKHAAASRISIDIRFTKQCVAVVVGDDGKGFLLEEKMQTGLGLRNLESRSEMANAKLKLKSLPERGTRAIIVLQANE
nr:sensor histidine kinase [uncultured Draconibacterium sp.]